MRHCSKIEIACLASYNIADTSPIATSAGKLPVPITKHPGF